MREYASRGWIIFDFTKHAMYENLIAPSNSYYGMWAHDLTLYRDILMNHEDCILHGRENLN